MLLRLDRVSRAFRDRAMSRLTRADSVSLVNGVLSALGTEIISGEAYAAFAAEAASDEHLAAAYELAKPRLATAAPGSNKIPFSTWRDRAVSLPSLISTCYVLIRATRPTLVVETGVWFGASTSLILAAMHRNAHGSLISIDLPGFADMDGNMSGTDHPFIPDAYKDRWDMRETDATIELPKIFLNEKPDIFMHDSDHSYNHMAFEFALATKYMPRRSIVISDDVRRNSAFYDVMSQAGATVFNHVQNPNIGVAVL